MDPVHLGLMSLISTHLFDDWGGEVEGNRLAVEHGVSYDLCHALQQAVVPLHGAGGQRGEGEAGKRMARLQTNTGRECGWVGGGGERERDSKQEHYIFLSSLTSADRCHTL